MEKILFEILKVKLQRHFMRLEQADVTRKENSLSGELWQMTQDWIRKSEQSGKESEMARAGLAEYLRQFKKYTSSRQWKLMKAFNNMAGILKKGKRKVNPADRVEEMAEALDRQLAQCSQPLKPYLFPLISRQFTGPAEFPAQQSITGKVAFIVLNRNGEEHLRHLFASFLKYDAYPNSEFIVVDHGSHDGSIAVIGEFTDRIIITLLRFDLNFSYSFSNNFAVGKSDAEYLFFLNNDILFDQEVTRPMVKILQSDQAIGMAGPALYFPTDDLRRSDRLQHAGIRFIYRHRHKNSLTFLDTDPPSFLINEYKHSHLFRSALIPVNATEPAAGLSYHPAFCTAAAMCRKADFIRAGGFDENYFYGYEDVDLSLSIRVKLGKKLALAGDLGMVHNESYTRKRDGLYTSTLKIHNLLVLTWRFGYFLIHEYLRDNPSEEILAAAPRPDTLPDWAQARREGRLHIAFKCPDTDESGEIAALKDFLEQGFSAENVSFRIDAHGKWYEEGILRDQAVISVTAGPVYYPQPGQINVLWVIPGCPPQNEGLLPFYDLVMTGREPILDRLVEIHREKTGTA